MTLRRRRDAALREAVALFGHRPLIVMSVWEPGLATMTLVPPPGEAGYTYLPDPADVAAVQRAESGHAADVAQAGARLARELGATAEAALRARLGRRGRDARGGRRGARRPGDRRRLARAGRASRPASSARPRASCCTTPTGPCSSSGRAEPGARGVSFASGDDAPRRAGQHARLRRPPHTRQAHEHGSRDPKTAARRAVRRRRSPRPADVFVVFGITGDLAKVMTFRSLYRLERARPADVPDRRRRRRRLDRRRPARARARTSIEATGRAARRRGLRPLRRAALLRLGRLRRRRRPTSGWPRRSATRAAPVFYLEIPPFLFGTRRQGPRRGRA